MSSEAFSSPALNFFMITWPRRTDGQLGRMIPTRRKARRVGHPQFKMVPERVGQPASQRWSYSLGQEISSGPVSAELRQIRRLRSS